MINKKKASKRGGARPGSGPKPGNAEDRKEQFAVYIQTKMIIALGGKEATRKIIDNAVVKEYERKGRSIS